MKLYLVQHGEALAAEVDPERPLSPVGRADVDALARFLAERGVAAARVVHSGKTRARETAERLAAAVAPEAAVERRDGLAPNDGVEGPARELAAGAEDTVLVGHQPFLGRLVARLVVGREDAGVVAFEPGGLVCLERQEGGEWAVAWMLCPALVSGRGRGGAG